MDDMNSEILKGTVSLSFEHDLGRIEAMNDDIRSWNHTERCTLGVKSHDSFDVYLQETRILILARDWMIVRARRSVCQKVRCE
jgi:hypothetical protein